ncbi:MAG: phosphodiester glycosidase family protein [Thermoflexales bacterium]|nr:phosphodiester glycosidase family protein [Thermoflexales bacterium]
MTTPRRPLGRRARVALGVVAAVCALCACAGISAVTNPQVGAQGADVLRKVIGDNAVAELETAVYAVKDRVDQTLFGLGLKKVSAPWAEATPIAVAVPTPTPEPTQVLRIVPTANPEHAEPVAPPTPRPFEPAAIKPFTQRPEEGHWQPYITGPGGRVIAYRAFVYPDAQRPYVSVGLVAFDLRFARLRYVPGTEEPVTTQAFTRTGRIPANDAVAGRLFAVFNGGFKTQHGRFGVYAAGKTLVPARTDLMTLAIDDDEALRIGPWTEAGVVGPQTVVWRQNGPPLVHNGEINPLTNDNSASNWGANIDGAVVVWRSGIGLSTDRRTLYYAAGGDLMASTLAKALRAAGAHNAMQLDINSFWVQFCAVRADGTTLKPEPLFDIMKGQQPDRYLKAYTRDYFYVSAP